MEKRLKNENEKINKMEMEKLKRKRKNKKDKRIQNPEKTTRKGKTCFRESSRTFLKPVRKNQYGQAHTEDIRTGRILAGSINRFLNFNQHNRAQLRCTASQSEATERVVR